MNLLILLLILCSIILIKSQKLLSIERVSNTSALITCDNCAFEKDRVYQLKITKYNDSKQSSMDYEMSETITKVNVSNLEPGTEYLVELIALTPNRKFDVYQDHFITKLNPPSNMKLLLLNETDISFEWTASQTNGNTYLIALANESQIVLDYIEVNKQESIKNFSQLTPGRAYNLVFLNCISHNNKTIVVSDPVHSRFRTRPFPPSDVRVNENTLSSHSFDIQWAPPLIYSEFDGYSASYQVKGKPFTMFIYKDKNRSTKITNSIEAGMTYKIKLNTVTYDNYKNQTIVSKSIYRKITTRPLPVLNLKARTVGKTKLFIEWKADTLSTHDSYLITYWEINSEEHQVHLTNTTKFLLSNLSHGHTYTISVVAVSNNILSNATYINQVVQVAKSKLIPYIIALFILSLISLVITGIFLLKTKNKGKTLAGDFEEQGDNLIALETPRTPSSNIYSASVPAPLIDESIKINREDLELNKEIGKGQFGTVYSGLILMKCAQLSKKEPVAIKTSTQERDMNSFLKEALLMKNFNHQNVLSLIGVSLDENGWPLVVLPFMKNGDLLKYIRNEVNQPTVKLLINFAIDVANGMEYLSSQHFIHRDLAARNCMLNEDLTVKIADFGLSRHLKANNIYISDNSMQLLPIRWMSIESIEKSVYDTKTDVWSYGVLVWEVLTRGVNPYSELNNREVLDYLKKGHRLPQPLYCPDPIYDTLLSCWDISPNERPSFTMLSNKFRGIIESSERNFQQKQVDINEANIYYNLSQSSN